LAEQLICNQQVSGSSPEAGSIYAVKNLKDNAMNMKLPVGMVTPYFVTQAERSIADVRDPAVLISRERLALDTLALFLAFLNEDLQPRKPGFRLFGKREAPPAPPPALDRARAMLRAITVESRWPGPAESVHTNHPVVVLANTLDLDVIQALSVMKLRGYILSIALDISTCNDIIPAFLDLLGRENPGATPPFTAPGGIVTGYGSYRGLTVVSGLRSTVFATGLVAGQILDQYPELASAPR
jgi:hypothetical protein